MSLVLVNLGSDGVLTEVSFEKVPGFVVKPTLNCLRLEIPTTIKLLLYPEPAVPTVFVELFTPSIFTWLPIDKSCGISVSKYANVPSQLAFAIILKLQYYCYMVHLLLQL